MSITIKRFIPQNAQVNRAYLIIGKKGSGKTTVLFTLLRELCERIDYATGMCGTRDGVEKMRRILPPDVIHNTFNSQVFAQTIQVLGRISQRPDYKRITAVILDDLAFARGSFKSEEMREAFMNGRWLGLLLMITQQYLMDLGPDLRGQIDYVFAMAETTKKTRMKLYDYYFGIFNSFAEFDRVFQQVTAKKGRALVLDTTGSSNIVQDRVFYFDGNPDCPDFVLGTDSFRGHIATDRMRRKRVLQSARPLAVLENPDETIHC
jgi:hypothetical protein